MNKLIDLLQTPYSHDTWSEDSKSAFEELFGGQTGRYPSNAQKEIQFRTPKYASGAPAPFSAIIHQSNPTSSGYGGMSFVIFPVEKKENEEGDTFPMIAMVTGTQGLSPDDHIIGKAGHSRKMIAICKWLNEEYGNGKMIAWAKKDAVRIDKMVPENVKKTFPEYADIFSKYGKEIYGFCKPNSEELREIALKAFLDFHFDERGYKPLSGHQDDFMGIQNSYFNYLMPTLSQQEVFNLLKHRKFVILQGPPGTGKTRMANKILDEDFGGFGKTIQFHPNTTYENFIGGLSPDTSEEGVGLKFKVKKGSLLEAVEMANQGKDTLLVIDEINRADLAKVLGEAIYCFEPGEKRSIDLPYDFGDQIGSRLSIPPNLYLLGTMNTADRSISILDVAIRRRFAFIDLWPQISVVQGNDDEFLLNAYKDLLTLFIEFASEDAFALMPGHSYFLPQKGMDSVQMLQTNLVPLLQEYLAQGYVANFADELYYYIQSLGARS
jgi:5-methylcytosine-specific restriction protein B